MAMADLPFLQCSGDRLPSGGQNGTPFEASRASHSPGKTRSADRTLKVR